MTNTTGDALTAPHLVADGIPQSSIKKKSMQSELPLIYVMRPAKGLPEPKIEPHRSELDASCAAVAAATRAAIESPSAANLRTLTDSVLRAHQTLLTLNYAEKELSA
jgi:hypothetical protein